jgi:hypothetical protein
MIDPMYTPICKTKAGEARAMMRLDRQTKRRIIPFFDVLALKTGLQNGADVHAHIEKQANNIAGAWNGSGPCYVDLLDITPSARGYSGEHPVAIIHDKIAYERVEAIPVVGIDRDVAYKLAIRRVMSAGAAAVAIRLADEDLQLPSTLTNKISALIGEVGASEAELHIFMDFRSIINQASDVVQSKVDRALTEIRKLKPARIVFAASAIVANMSGFKRNTINKVIRRDYLNWMLIAKRHSDVDFADYGVIDPEYLDIDPKLIKPAAKIRYTCDDHWIIVKGIKWVRDTSQHRRLAEMLSKKSEFRGADCWGTESIVSTVSGGRTYRRLEDWVTIDQNTHIVHTVRQLEKVRLLERVTG